MRLFYFKLLTEVIAKNCYQQHGDDSDDDVDDRFDDKTTPVTNDDHEDSDASFVCVCVSVWICVYLTFSLYILALDSRAKRCVANLCKNVRCVCVSARACVCVRDRER